MTHNPVLNSNAVHKAAQCRLVGCAGVWLPALLSGVGRTAWFLGVAGLFGWPGILGWFLAATFGFRCQGAPVPLGRAVVSWRSVRLAQVFASSGWLGQASGGGIWQGGFRGGLGFLAKFWLLVRWWRYSRRAA